MERSHTPVWVRATGPVTADPMQTFARLPEILYEEERATYEKSVAAAPAQAAYVRAPRASARTLAERSVFLMGVGYGGTAACRRSWSTSTPAPCTRGR